MDNKVFTLDYDSHYGPLVVRAENEMQLPTAAVPEYVTALFTTQLTRFRRLTGLPATVSVGITASSIAFLYEPATLDSIRDTLEAFGWPSRKNLIQTPQNASIVPQESLSPTDTYLHILPDHTVIINTDGVQPEFPRSSSIQDDPPAKHQKPSA